MSETRYDLVLRANEACTSKQLVLAEELALRAVSLPAAASPLAESETELLLGWILQTVHQHDLAEQAFRKAVELVIAGNGTVWQLALARYAHAEHLLARGHYAAVVEVVADIPPTAVNYPHARALSAVALAELGRPDADAAIADALAAADEHQREHVLQLLGRHAPGTAAPS